MVGELAIERGIAADTLSDAAAGDALALARIVEAYHNDMARLCFVICGDRDTAQEAVQAAWSIAWRKLGSLREPASLRAWLMTIAANEVRQQLRRQKRERVVQIEIIDIGSERLDPASRAGVLDLRTALAQLTPRTAPYSRCGMSPASPRRRSGNRSESRPMPSEPACRD
jgi:DNA-directed RNA polymerase specialized sigma24 family protein